MRRPPFSFSPNMVRKTVKLIGPLASLIMASSSSFLVFSWPERHPKDTNVDQYKRDVEPRVRLPAADASHRSPIEARTSLRSSLLMMPSLFWSMIVKAYKEDKQT